MRVGVLLLFVAACSRDGYDCRDCGGASCTANAECVDDVCIHGTCAAASGAGGACDESEDCAAGHACSGGVCVLLTCTPLGAIDYDNGVFRGCTVRGWQALEQEVWQWQQVSAGWWHTCGLRVDGTVWCWGRSAVGRLGNGTTAPDSATPVQVQTDTGLGGWSDWQQISVDKGGACGLRAAGTVWCWGGGSLGGNGNDSGADALSPVQVVDDAGTGAWSDWTAVTRGERFGCGLRQDGTLWCWGNGNDGRLGNGESTGSLRPVQVQTNTGPGGWSDWTDIAAGDYGACGLRANGTAWCWGGGTGGRLGNGDDSQTTQTRPVQVVDESGTGSWSDWRVITTTRHNSCGIRDNGTAWCWGSDGYGNLGDGYASLDTSRPVQVQTDTGPGHWSDWVAIHLGDGDAAYDGVCGIRGDSSAWCWGWDGFGQLGTGSAASTGRPLRVLADTGTEPWSDWVQINRGAYQTCGIRADGSAWCMGRSEDGALGNDAFSPDHDRPVRVTTDAGLAPVGAVGDITYDRVHDRFLGRTSIGWVGLGTRLELPLAHDLIAYWPLDGDSLDATGAHHGEPFGGVSFASAPQSRVSGAARFNGVDGRIRVPYDPALDFGLDSFTVAAWYYREGLGNGSSDFVIASDEFINDDVEGIGLLFARNIFSARPESGDNLRVELAGAPSMLAWHHVAMVVDRTEGRGHCYVDAEEIAAPDVTSLGAVNHRQAGGDNDLVIGARRHSNASTTDTNFEGLIDDLRIYRRALSASEIASLHATAGCSDPAAETGSIQYDNQLDRIRGCTPAGWVDLHD